MPVADRRDISVPSVIEHKIVDRTTGRLLGVKRYKKGKLLGKGGFAHCYELISFDSNRTYAGKVIPKYKLQKKRHQLKLLAEIKIHRFVSEHKHITLMELVERRGRLTEPEVQYYMLQLISAVRFLHNLNVIHRDLKLGNIFLGGNMNIKLGDFGLATRLGNKDERKRTMCGTPNYIAPEILAHSAEGHSFEVDIWSMGVIMYTLLIGVPPFETSNIKLTYRRIRANYYKFPEDVPVSHEARSLIRRILHVDPKRRPSLEQIRSDLFFLRSPVPRLLPPSSLFSVPDFPDATPVPPNGAGTNLDVYTVPAAMAQIPLTSLPPPGKTDDILAGLPASEPDDLVVLRGLATTVEDGAGDVKQ
eukprot:439215_1